MRYVAGSAVTDRQTHTHRTTTVMSSQSKLKQSDFYRWHALTAMNGWPCTTLLCNRMQYYMKIIELQSDWLAQKQKCWACKNQKNPQMSPDPFPYRGWGLGMWVQKAIKPRTQDSQRKVVLVYGWLSLLASGPYNVISSCVKNHWCVFFVKKELSHRSSWQANNAISLSAKSTQFKAYKRLFAFSLWTRKSGM